jgi:transcription elongation GreA/GreB family factor
MKEAEHIKSTLFKLCIALVEERIQNAQQAIQAAQESANAEEKRSAGDKYETGRAMAQIERDKAAHQLHEAILLKNALNKVNLKPTLPQVCLGSLVMTDKNRFFIAISMGKHHVAESDYFIIAPSTPIGRLMMGLKAGDQFLFNKQLNTIKEIL